MGLAHALGIGDGGERWLCTSCGRFVRIEPEPEREGEGDEGAGQPDPAADEDPACPNCGSRGMRRIALL